MGDSVPSIRLQILTTLGPSAIVYLGRENPESGVLSMIRVDGEVEPAPIGRGYAHFIDVFVQRLSGHRVYRADISSSIDDGGSWRLGFLLAHCILEDPSLRLACDDEPADLTVFATGDLRDRPHSGRVEILPVSGIDEKLTHAEARIKADKAAGTDVLVLLPADETADDGVDFAHPGIDDDAVHRVADVEEALSLIRARFDATERPHSPASPSAPVGDESREGGRRSSSRVLALAVAAVALTAVFVVSVLNDIASPGANDDPSRVGDVDSGPPIALDLSTVAVPVGMSCDSPDARIAPLAFSNGPGLRTLVRPPGRLCAFAVALENQGARPVSLEGTLGAVIGEGPSFDIAGAQSRSVDIAAGSTADIRLPFPRFRLGGERFQFVLRATGPEVDGPSPSTEDGTVLKSLEFSID